MVDEATKKTLASILLLKIKAGPRDKESWPDRLREEYCALIKYVESNKEADNDWFRLESNSDGTKWWGKCWYIHELLKYEFNIEFDIPVTYPTTPPEIAIPELDGKTAKMYRGGKICMTDHFKPLWARNVGKFGIAHAMALGVCSIFLNNFYVLYKKTKYVKLGPWLAVEVPDLIQRGIVVHKEASGAGATASAK